MIGIYFALIFARGWQIVMAMNSMAGEKREQYYPKVARLIAKETVIDRE